jgi:hypothetical protein
MFIVNQAGNDMNIIESYGTVTQATAQAKALT